MEGGVPQHHRVSSLQHQSIKMALLSVIRKMTNSHDTNYHYYSIRTHLIRIFYNYFRVWILISKASITPIQSALLPHTQLHFQILQFYLLEEAQHVSFDGLANFIGLDWVGVADAQQHLQSQNFEVDAAVFIAQMFSAVDKLRVLYPVLFIIKTKHTLLSFIGPLLLKIDQIVGPCLRYFIAEKTHQAIFTQILQLKKRQQAHPPELHILPPYLPVHAVDPHKQFAHLVLCVRSTELCQERSMFGEISGLGSDDLLQLQRVLAVEIEEMDAVLGELKAVFMFQ